jgi:hypothetical protein
MVASQPIKALRAINARCAVKLFYSLFSFLSISSLRSSYFIPFIGCEATILSLRSSYFIPFIGGEAAIYRCDSSYFILLKNIAGTE